jgi:hypothetical protein
LLCNTDKPTQPKPRKQNKTTTSEQGLAIEWTTTNKSSPTYAIIKSVSLATTVWW